MNRPDSAKLTKSNIFNRDRSTSNSKRLFYDGSTTDPRNTGKII